MRDWEPTGDELRSAALHAACESRRYRGRADEWEAETCRLADLIADDNARARRRSGMIGRLADVLGISRGTFDKRRDARHGRAG